MSKSADPRLVWLMLYDPQRGCPGSPEPANTALTAVSDPIAMTLADAARAVMPAAVAAGGITSVNASSLIVGADAAHALELDHSVVAAQRQGFDALVTAFGQSPLTGCTSVMDLALSGSGWNPLDPRQTGNHDGFARYVSIIAATPFFDRPPGFVRNSLDLRNYRNPPALVGGIAALLSDITETDKRRVVNAILDMTHAVFNGNGDTRSAQATLFVQHAVAVNAGKIAVNLYWSQAMMHYERHSSKTSVSVETQSVFNVERVSLSFPTVNWLQYAEAVARRKVTDVQTWLTRTAAPG